MSRDSSLDEFLATDDEESDAEDDPREGDAGEASDDPEPTEDGDESGDPAQTEDGDESGDPAQTEGGDESGDATAPSTVADPATSTLRYSPDGAECEACGETVTRRWQDGDAAVCSGCKEW